MLVLTRKFQQQIKIGDQITVTILRVKGQTVRVGIDAPREVRVVRGELLLQDSTAEASQPSTTETTVQVVAGEDEAEAAEETSEPKYAGKPITSTLAILATRISRRKHGKRAAQPPLRMAMAAAAALAK